MEALHRTEVMCFAKIEKNQKKKYSKNYGTLILIWKIYNEEFREYLRHLTMKSISV